MRAMWMLAAAALLAMATACAERSVDMSPPTVTYTYDDADDFDEVEEEAIAFCAEEYGRDAVLADQAEEDGDYVAVFACE